ncbi:NfeD family protein [Jiella pacifica]|uniref:NfeD family protein n=1 Tax=Jiella pacifica TaxID=2696469 RepID=A0A6N9T1J2_9HYPH|nr:NfeD family protein [Jiella pacifica]NDW05187.1 NfeD family protein [Jiella pacifica]
MDALIETLANYGWWIAGLVLLILEVVAPGAYLIFFGIAALIVGTNAFFVGAWFDWPQQVIAFIVVSAVCIYLGRRWYGREPVKDEGPPLNRRTGRLIGREATLSEAIVAGRGRVAIEDSWWSVSGPDLPQGTRVRIVGAESAVLQVEPVE